MYESVHGLMTLSPMLTQPLHTKTQSPNAGHSRNTRDLAPARSNCQTSSCRPRLVTPVSGYLPLCARHKPSDWSRLYCVHIKRVDV
jgi:hypothetical protein